MYQVTAAELRKSLQTYLAVYMPAGLRLATDSDREQLLDGIIRTVLGKSGRLLFPDPGSVPDNLSGGFTAADVGWGEADPDPAAGIPSRDDDMAQLRYQRARKIAAARAAKG
jgi:hypothetical protein